MNQPIDRSVKRRALIALAGAIAIHEIIAGFVPSSHPKPQPTPIVISEQITLQRRATPRPTPPPTPRPEATQPPTPPPVAKPAHRVFVAAAPKLVAPRHHHRGGAAARHSDIIIAHRPKIVALVTPAPLRAGGAFERGNAQGLANGGSGTGAGPGNGDSGDEGNGIGNGPGGNGTGLDSPMSPCGHPYFEGLRNHYRDGKFYEDVRILIRLRDGRMFEDDLHWPWIYASEAENPWSDQNLSKDMEVSLQFPPPGYDLADSQKPETVTAIKNTKVNGGTDLPDCPGGVPGA